MKKKFKLGFMVGRFQMLHKGHESLINEGLELCERFVLLIGNSEESRTKNNPFTFEERKEMIKTVFGDKVEVYPIISIGIGYVPAWGNYIMNTIKFYCGEYPDFVLRGSDDGRSEWLDKAKYDNITEYIISRNLIKVSATQVREKLLEWYHWQCEKVMVKQSTIDFLVPRGLSHGSLLQISGLSSQDKANIQLVESYLKDNLSDKYTDEQLKKYGNILNSI